MTFTPASFTFTGQAVGTTGSAQVVTVTNVGTTQLDAMNRSIAGANAADYALTTTCGTTLAAATSC